MYELDIFFALADNYYPRSHSNKAAFLYRIAYYRIQKRKNVLVFPDVYKTKATAKQ